MDGKDWEQFIKFYCLLLRKSINRIIISNNESFNLYSNTNSNQTQKSKSEHDYIASLKASLSNDSKIKVVNSEDNQTKINFNNNPFMNNIQKSNEELINSLVINSKINANSNNITDTNTNTNNNINDISNENDDKELNKIKKATKNKKTSKKNLKSNNTGKACNNNNNSLIERNFYQNKESSMNLRFLPIKVFEYICKFKNLLFNLSCNLLDPLFIHCLKQDIIAQEALVEYISSIVFYFCEYCDMNLMLLKKKKSFSLSHIIDIATVLFSIINNCDNYANLSLINDYNNEFKKALSNITEKFDLDIYDLINVKFNKIGIMKIDFKGKIIECDEYFQSYLLESEDNYVTNKSFYNFISKQSFILFKNEFPTGLLDFKNGVIQRSVKLTIKTFEDCSLEAMLGQEDNINQDLFEDFYLIYLNSMKTLDVRLSTLIGYDKDRLLTEELVIVEAKLARERQNFDMDYVFDVY